MDRVSRRYRDIEIVDDEQFDYTGYQIVRGEFFAHTFEPAIVFNKGKVSVNSACLRKLPETEFVQILVNPEQRKLAVLPSKEEEKDSFRWCTNGKKRMPRQITCRVFYAKVMSLMDWNPDYKYKILGKLIRSNNQLIFVYDLTTPETFIREETEDSKAKYSRMPLYPEEWRSQFGLPVEEHQKRMQINRFDSYTTFSVKQDDIRKPVSSEAAEEEVKKE